MFPNVRLSIVGHPSTPIAAGFCLPHIDNGLPSSAAEAGGLELGQGSCDALQRHAFLLAWNSDRERRSRLQDRHNLWLGRRGRDEIKSLLRRGVTERSVIGRGGGAVAQ